MYVLPFWDFLIVESEKLNTDFTLDSIVDFRVKLFSSIKIKKKFPKTSDLIDKISRQLQETNEDVLWNGIANSCRDLMIEFSKELGNKIIIQELDTVKKGDFKNTISIILKKQKSSKRFSSSLIKLMESIWDHASSGTHKSDLTRDEAIRIFVWSLMDIYEIDNFLYDDYQVCSK